MGRQLGQLILAIILVFFLLSPVGAAETITFPQSNTAEGYPDGTWDGSTCTEASDSGDRDFDDSGNWSFKTSTGSIGGQCTANQGLYLDTGVSHGGSNSFRHGVNKNDWEGRVQLGHTGYDYFDTTSLYIRYWFKTSISAGDLSPQGPKVQFFAGSTSDFVMTWGTSAGNGLRLQFWWRSPSNSLCLTEGEEACYTGSGGSPAGTAVYIDSRTPDALWDAYNDGSWHKIEFWYQFESPYDADDGVFQWWIDDVLIAHYNDVDYMDNSGQDIREIGIGGNWSGTTTNGVYYTDDIYIDDSLETAPDPLVSINVTDATATEEGPTTGTLEISCDDCDDLSVTFVVTGTAVSGTDYQALSSPVIITNEGTPEVLTVTPVDDVDPEDVETVIVTLQDGASYNLGSPISGTVNILDNDLVAGSYNLVGGTLAGGTLGPVIEESGEDTGATLGGAGVVTTTGGTGTMTMAP